LPRGVFMARFERFTLFSLSFREITHGPCVPAGFAIFSFYKNFELALVSPSVSLVEHVSCEMNQRFAVKRIARSVLIMPALRCVHVLCLIENFFMI